MANVPQGPMSNAVCDEYINEVEVVLEGRRRTFTLAVKVSRSAMLQSDIGIGVSATRWYGLKTHKTLVRFWECSVSRLTDFFIISNLSTEASSEFVLYRVDIAC